VTEYRVQGFYEPDVVLRAVFLQFDARCERTCAGCGGEDVITWQACNTCALWPGVRPDAFLTVEQVALLARQLSAFDVRSVFICGGNPLQDPERLSTVVRVLRQALPTPSFVVMTPGGRIADPLRQGLAATGAKLNLVALQDLNGVSNGSEVGGAADECSQDGIPWYLTRFSRTPDARSCGMRLDEHCAITVLDAEILSFAAAGVRGSALATYERLRPDRGLSAAELCARSRWNPCLHGVLAIAADGVIRPCPMIDRPIGTLASGIDDVFRRHAAEWFWRLTKDAIAPCSGCEYRYGCATCTAVDMGLAARRPDADRCLLGLV
jgi:radical SAM protein with 4Fe4S-binding SPASM domain